MLICLTPVTRNYEVSGPLLLDNISLTLYVFVELDLGYLLRLGPVSQEVKGYEPRDSEKQEKALCLCPVSVQTFRAGLPVSLC